MGDRVTISIFLICLGRYITDYTNLYYLGRICALAGCVYGVYIICKPLLVKAINCLKSQFTR